MIVTDRKPVAQKTYKTGLKAQCFCQVRMKDALGSGGTQQPGSVGEFLRSRKQDVYSPQDCQSGSKDVRAGHGRRAGDCLTGKSCGALMALNFPGHKNTNDSRLASSFPPSLFSFWQPYSLPWLFLPKAKEARLSSLKNGILSLGQPDELTHRPPWFSKVSASCSLGLTHCLPQNSIHPSSFPALVSSFSHFCTGQLISTHFLIQPLAQPWDSNTSWLSPLPLPCTGEETLLQLLRIHDLLPIAHQANLSRST